MKSFIESVKQAIGLAIAIIIGLLILAIPLLYIVYQIKKFWFFMTH